MGRGRGGGGRGGEGVVEGEREGQRSCRRPKPARARLGSAQTATPVHRGDRVVRGGGEAASDRRCGAGGSPRHNGRGGRCSRVPTTTRHRGWDTLAGQRRRGAAASRFFWFHLPHAPAPPRRPRRVCRTTAEAARFPYLPRIRRRRRRRRLRRRRRRRRSHVPPAGYQCPLPPLSPRLGSTASSPPAPLPLPPPPPPLGHPTAPTPSATTGGMVSPPPPQQAGRYFP